MAKHHNFYSRFTDINNPQLQAHNRAHVVINIIEDLTNKGEGEEACIENIREYLDGMSKREMYNLKIWLSKFLLKHPFIKFKDEPCDVHFAINHSTHQ